ncbi:MAG: hypothetical protein E6J82_02795 [Deltaproteobacteria bacterium]|nr:MAG: hypothetical protein E6J82_02795 [Deltaproteobacteria bacterium]
MSGERQDMDPAAQVAAELRARLRSLGADEVIELCAQLLTTYVVEGVLPLSRASESSDLAPDVVGEETFAQMLKRLKAAKKDPVLERFIIDGESPSTGVRSVRRRRGRASPCRWCHAGKASRVRRAASTTGRCISQTRRLPCVGGRNRRSSGRSPQGRPRRRRLSRSSRRRSSRRSRKSRETIGSR